MEDNFYIVETRIGWYAMRLKSSHYTLSCGSLEGVLNSIKMLVKKYRSIENLMKALSNTDDKGIINSPATYEAHKQQYEEQLDKYSDLIEKAVAEVKPVRKLPPLRRKK